MFDDAQQQRVRARGGGLDATVHIVMLLRTFLRRSLAAYFERTSSPVGALPTPLDLASLAGEPAYRAAVRAAYDALGTAWLTPSELLRPLYGRAVGETVYDEWRRHGGGAPLHIVEVGVVGFVGFVGDDGCCTRLSCGAGRCACGAGGRCARC